ncbi:30S ribosomal protein S8 [Candidatus Peregrinibacteria bacterium]|jgi:small subunit ribosomal protein S8|nr:30S ribosomal protein S8 [Candidatus Peregrinibacteria bacterium]MBT4631635.1 30S ribosomal protein S8 [Candidatus Peregrinibacteria bacterium]MBT5516763.1 30S ribosomal protein S8 [Candidatus Peregrinibacteria bacterium]MBT5823955.1 30S ribosomal protein S8 [Candidatus Peregrinibacteria bacterium]
MTVTDPIADLLTRIRNAARANKNMVHMPHSKLKESISKVLVENDYVISAKSIGEGINKELAIELKEDMQKLHLKRISKPGQRIYLKSREIPRVLDGLGIAIVSTPKGVMTGKQARKSKMGGEYLCEVY